MLRRGAALAAICVMLTMALSACDDGVFDGGVRGSGNLITETRDVAAFDAIVVDGSGTINVSVTGTESLMIEAEDNIMPRLTADVRSGTLILGSDGSFSTTRGITYTITVADLTGVEINGSGDVVAFGIDTSSFDVTISGSGNVEPHGSSNDVNIAVSGSGNYEGAELVAITADVAVSGSGGVTVNVTDALDVSISGSGNVRYLGDPQVDESITGSGSVSRS